MKRLFSCLLFVCLAALAVFAEEPKPADYSREAFVIEQLYFRERYEADGTGRRESTARIRVQSDAGVAQLGQLVEGYNSGNERFEVGYVRVRKPDGSVIAAGPEAVQELTAPAMREAPMYSDFRQKHITVPALSAGDILEYQFIAVLHTPLAPGQFWTEHQFVKHAIVLDEVFEVNIPRARTVKVKNAKGSEPKITDEGDRRVYRWASSNLERDADENKPTKDKKKKKKRPSEPEGPAVQMTTFSSWEEVGRWYAALEKPRREPTPEVRDRAVALTAGRKTDLEKVEALYDFVARNHRYVSLSFGMGRYQPHAAADVLANQYGDCKDKHTLLASLLDAVGIHANTVLIHSSRKLDADVPSPAQFDHVITAVPLGKELVWLDTTTEVAPFRLLVFQLRKKQALMVPPDGKGTLVETPADPPFPNTNTIEATGQVSELGKLLLKTRDQVRGDLELNLRLLFRRVPQAEWKQVGNMLASRLGPQTEMTEFTPSSPNATGQPFSLDYTVSRPNYFDWSSKKSKLDIPAIMSVQLPDPEDDPDSTEPLKLGIPIKSSMHLRLTFPDAVTVHPPLPITVTRDYGEYRSEYKLEGHTLDITRSIEIKQTELPAARLADYRAFRRSIGADFEQRIAVESANAGKSTLPEGTKVEELFDAAYAAQNGRNWDTAALLYKRVVELEPKHKYAWNNLGQVQMALAQVDAAIASYRKAIEVNPYDEWAYNNLGRALWTMGRYDEATAAFKKQIEVNPLDRYAHSNLGHLYLEQHKYAEALPELEKAASLTPDDVMLKVAIGQAQLNLGNSEKALEAFDQAAESSPNPVVWNNIAYELSLKKVHLDRAQKYAESAVETTAATLRNLTLEDARDARAPEYASYSIASYWDTLGWVYFQRGDLDKAERYILPAWQVSQSGEVGDHLGQIYEKRGELAKATRYYALALIGGGHPNPETRGRLAKLLGSDSKVDAELKRIRPELLGERTVKVTKLPGESATAEFDVMLTPGPKVEAVKFVKGSDKLKPYTELLRTAPFTQAFPDASPLRLARRGILSCTEQPQCRFVLLSPDARLEAETRAELEKTGSAAAAK